MLPIYESRGRAMEYSFLAVNLLRGCSSRCSYCYVAGASHMSREQWEAINPTPRKGVIEALRKQVPEFAGTDKRVLLCFMCDPYQPAAVESGITREALEILREFDVPFQVLTKHGRAAVRDFDLYGSNDAFATTLTFVENKDSLEWESGAAWPADRVEAIRIAHDRGIQTWGSLEPVLDPTQSLRIIGWTHKFVDLYKVGRWNHDARANEIDWRSFGIAAINLLEMYGKPYYIKDDLAKHLQGVKFTNTDTRTIQR